MALVCDGTGMDEEGASTVCRSDSEMGLAGDYIVEATRRRPLLTLMTDVRAVWGRPMRFAIFAGRIEGSPPAGPSTAGAATGFLPLQMRGAHEI
jgi:hypothetical protein